MNKKDDFVSVSVRIRPHITTDSTFSSSIQVINNKELPVLVVTDRPQTYQFDNIFVEDAEQETIYNETVKNLVGNVKKGFNCTVFAYGQTGTGKTFTMGTNPEVDDPKDVGLIPRTIEEFFELNEDYEVDISVSFIEIYNEKVFDLLQNNNKPPLLLKGFRVQGFSQERVFNCDEAKQFLRMGNKNRHTGETKQNISSSRSHAIFTIYCNVMHNDHATSAKLNLVDLAGSESVKKTGTQGSSFHEGVNINKGLLSIGQVMTALCSNSSFIPYRQSVITSILQDSLNKQNYVSLIACIKASAEDTNETVQTLEFAHRVKKMKNNPCVNEIVSKYKKDNPNIFTNSKIPRTPFKRHNMTPLKTPSTVKKFKPNFTPRTKFPQPSFNPNFTPQTNFNHPPINSTTTSTIFESHQSLSISAISMESTAPPSFSPVIKKYMTAMEASLMDKLETVIKQTLRRSSRRSVLEKESQKENANTPGLSWSKIQNEVSKMVQTEIKQFTVKANRAASSPIEDQDFTNIRRVLTYDSPKLNDQENDLNNLELEHITDDIIFKMPQLPATVKAKPRKNSSVSPLSSIENTMNNKQSSFTDSIIVPGRRRSVRIINRNTTIGNVLATPKMTPNLATPEVETVITNRRRSVRIHQKKELKRDESPEGHKKKTPRTVAQTPRNGSKKAKSAKSPFTNHQLHVLDVLNSGNLKKIEKLHTIGPKTAEKIFLYRELKGDFKSVSDLCEVPGWTTKRYDRFMEQNLLNRD